MKIVLNQLARDVLPNSCNRCCFPAQVGQNGEHVSARATCKELPFRSICTPHHVKRYQPNPENPWTSWHFLECFRKFLLMHAPALHDRALRSATLPKAGNRLRLKAESRFRQPCKDPP